MSQVFEDDGTVVPVTVVEVQPNIVTQIKTKEKDGYEGVQLEIGTKNKNLKEFRSVAGELKAGDKIDASIFNQGDLVKVTGMSKGKGFQGVVKRHGFSGMPASHGAHSVLRHAGSIGQRFPQHTLKGMRMAGRMGHDKVTTRGLKIVRVDAENGLLAIKGAVPGSRGQLLMIQSQ